MEPLNTSEPTLPDSTIATIRTAAQALAGVILYAIFNSPLGDIPLLSSLSEAQLIGILVPLLTAIWTACISFLERRVNPMFGALFVVPKRPNYS